MEKRVQADWLLDFYGPLLTPRQQTLLRLYCGEDLSLGEIAAQEGISRQAVHDAVRRGQAQLLAYEARLGLLARHRRLQERVSRGVAMLSALRSAPEDRAAFQEALGILTQLLDDEEGSDGL
ncbi:MAG: YlxM family DNA-binding protein [Oscillospiraceae bacterium]|jgi:predicted DNA-binding protein YlxM (UPF0122 family)|nr:YlxM family DNA-binding protein [Oscillospiraceae bacterium]